MVTALDMLVDSFFLDDSQMKVYPVLAQFARRSAVNTPSARSLQGITYTPHPVTEPKAILKFVRQQREMLMQDPAYGRDATWAEFRALYRREAIDEPDPQGAPALADEWECQLLALGLTMDHDYEAPSAFEHVDRPRTWIGRDHDGTGLRVGVREGELASVRCAEIVTVCDWLLAKLPEDGDARELLCTTRDAAAQLGDLRHQDLTDAEYEDRRTGLVEQLDLKNTGARLLEIAPCELQGIVEKFGLGGFRGEVRIGAKDIGTPKMHAILDEIKAAAPLQAVESIVIADCDGADLVRVLRTALNQRGLDDVKIIPLLESEQQLDRFFADEYREVSEGEVMMAGSDYPRNVGTAQSILDTDEFFRVCDERGLRAYQGTGHDPQRSGYGNSLLARDKFFQEGPRAAQHTLQGPVLPLQLLSLSDHVRQVQFKPGVDTTREDNTQVSALFGPLIARERADRCKDSEFAALYARSKLPDVEFPPAGSRDRQKKSNLGTGPFESRAIAVHNRLKFGHVGLGMACGALTPEQIDAMVSGINALKASGTPGARHLVDKIMYNYALQVASCHDKTESREMWEALQFSPDDIKALEKSNEVMSDLLARTGYSASSNLELQQMIADDYTLDISATELPDNLAAIQRQMGMLHRAKLAFLRGEPQATFRRTELLATMRRSFGTALR